MSKSTSILANAGIYTGPQYLKSEKFNPFYEMTGKLNLTISLKVNENYSQFSKWEKLFVENFYGKNNNNIVLEKPTNKETRLKDIREDINNELNKLYAVANDESYFAISIEDNKLLEREFESELKALEARGLKDEADILRLNKESSMKHLAEKFAQSQQEEYKNIVEFIKSSDYEPAFKVLMLRETLLQTYKQIQEDGLTKTIVEKRVPHKTLTGHMIFNETTLSTIYNNLDNYTSFANLYYAGVALSNKQITKDSGIVLDGVDTFGMGALDKI